jgi:hypothetical protein
MRKACLTLFLVTVLISLQGQRVGNKVSKELKQLAITKIDSLLIYNLYCNGGLLPFDSCQYENDQFLFWKQGTNYFCKKFSYCKTYKAVLLDNINPFSFYLSNKSTIDKETIKKPVYVKIEKKGIKTIETITVDHTCFYEMSFVLNKRKTVKVVNDFFLTFEKFDDGKPNTNFKSNQNTKLRILVENIKLLLDKFDADNKFIEE